MTNPLTRAMKAMMRRWRRNMFSLFAVLFCATTLVTLQGIGLASSDRTAQRFLDMEDSSIEVTLPRSTWDLDDKELCDRLAGFPQVQAAGTLDIPDGQGSL